MGCSQLLSVHCTEDPIVPDTRPSLRTRARKKRRGKVKMQRVIRRSLRRRCTRQSSLVSVQACDDNVSGSLPVQQELSAVCGTDESTASSTGLSLRSKARRKKVRGSGVSQRKRYRLERHSLQLKELCEFRALSMQSKAATVAEMQAITMQAMALHSMCSRKAVRRERDGAVRTRTSPFSSNPRTLSTLQETDDDVLSPDTPNFGVNSDVGELTAPMSPTGYRMASPSYHSEDAVSPSLSWTDSGMSPLGGSSIPEDFEALTDRNSAELEQYRCLFARLSSTQSEVADTHPSNLSGPFCQKLTDESVSRSR